MVYSSLLVLSLTAFICIKQVSTYPPFMLFTTWSKSTLKSNYDYKLPNEMVKSGEKWKLMVRGFMDSVEIPFCPEISTDSQDAQVGLTMIHKRFPNSKNCLFRKFLEENEPEICEKEPQFTIENEIYDDKSPVLCGSNEYQQLVNVQYSNCGTNQELIEYKHQIDEAHEKGIKEFRPIFKVKHYVMYQICYDFENRHILWTKHQLMTPKLLANKHLPTEIDPSSNDLSINEFSTDTFNFNLDKSTFVKLKKSYETTDPHINILYTLVPKDHMALRYWKNATAHMMNSAPLSPKLLSIMKVINNGIFLAANYLYKRSGINLKIYTKADSNISMKEGIFAHFSKLKTVLTHAEPEPINLFKPNVWYKLVYNEIEKSGILIILQNIGAELSNEERRVIDNESCDFKTWSSSSAFKVEDEFSLNHAFCWSIPNQYAEILFPASHVEITKPFEIQDIINKALKETPADNEQPMKTVENSEKNK